MFNRSGARRGWLRASVVAAVAGVALAVCPACGGSAGRPNPVGGGVTGGHHASARLPRLIDDFFANDPTNAWRNRRAVLVFVGGRQVVSRYHHSSPSATIDIQSAGKSITATLIGIALGEHLLPGLDATLPQLLPAYRSVMAASAKTITLRQLLTMTAGLPDTATQTWGPHADWVAKILATGRAQPPGHFLYSSAGSHLLSAILSQATGRSLLDYARQELFDPLGIITRPAPTVIAVPVHSPQWPRMEAAYRSARFVWPVDPAGHYTGMGGLKLTALDMAKLGELWLHHGRLGTRQLVPAAWITAATTPHVHTGFTFGEDYGYQFWVSTINGHRAFAALGFGGQIIEVVPDLDLVVVTQAATPDDPTAPLDQGSADLMNYLSMIANTIVPEIR
jgi:CubicO group peptidase (beta-lactamase class C family)